jgi:hypothetical protein
VKERGMEREVSQVDLLPTTAHSIRQSDQKTSRINSNHEAQYLAYSLHESLSILSGQ